MAPHSSTLAWKIPWMEEPGRLQPMGSLRVGHDWATSPSFFHFHALEKEMATHSSTLAWRIPGTEEPSGLPSVGSHRVGHDWSDLAAAAAALDHRKFQKESSKKTHLLLIYWLHQSLWLYGSQQTLENSSRDGNTRPPDLPLEKFVCRSGSKS